MILLFLNREVIEGRGMKERKKDSRRSTTRLVEGPVLS